MAKENSKIKDIDIDLDELLGETDETPEIKNSKEEIKASEQNAKEAEDAIKDAAATAALKAAIEANNKASLSNAEKTYIINKKKFMLNKCKEDEVVTFVGNAVYAQYFGRVYSFMFNTIPVVVKFDGSKQEFPKFIYDEIMERISKVSAASTPKVVEETLN